MIYPVLLILLVAAAFGIHVVVRYTDARRPDDVSAARWAWHIAMETAAMWACYARSVPARIRALREGPGSQPPPSGPASRPKPPASAANGNRPAALPPAPPAADTGGAVIPVLDGTLIPPDHAAVHSRIANQEFETDAELLNFYLREAAAFAGYAEVWGEHADMLLHGVGLDPSFTQVAAELADEVSEIAHAFAVIMHRFDVVYGDVQQWVANGGVLPFDARRFLTGGTGEAA